MKVKGKRLLYENQQSRHRDGKRRGDLIFFTFFLLALALSTCATNIYRMTVIAPRYLFVTGCFGTIIVALLLFLVMKSSLNLFKTFFFALSIGGSIPCFLLLYLNKSLGNKEVTSEFFVIRKTGSLAKGKYGGCGSPYAETK